MEKESVKAISLWQPWASLMVTKIPSMFHGGEPVEWQPPKTVETRSWPTPHRGTLVIHAAKYKGPKVGDIFENGTVRLLLKKMGFEQDGSDLPRGALLGTVHVISCKATDPPLDLSAYDTILGDYSPGRFGWFTWAKRAVEFPKPIPWRGRQGMWKIPADVLP